MLTNASSVTGAGARQGALTETGRTGRRLFAVHHGGYLEVDTDRSVWYCNSMMTIHVTTQYMENYGSPDAPYWKGKGGDIIVLTGVPAGADPATVVDTMRS
jgi:hypothetical protein